MIRGVTASCWDLIHSGHYLMLEEAKSQCDYLIVFLQTDPTVDRQTKNKPVQSITERFIQVRACKFVDEIIVYETEADLYALLSSVQFDKRFIGADWRGKEFTGHDIPNMIEKLVFNTRNHSYSTSSLRERIAEAENKKNIGKK